jgi:hypothetical protein
MKVTQWSAATVLVSGVSKGLLDVENGDGGQGEGDLPC